MAAWWLWFTGLGYFAAIEIAKERVNARWSGDLGEQLRTDQMANDRPGGASWSGWSASAAAERKRSA